MAAVEVEWIAGGGVTSASSFEAAGVRAGLKKYGPEPRLDVGLLVSRRACVVAGIFTQNKVQGAPVIVTQQRVASGAARALIVNSGNSNVATGAPGIADAEQMAAQAAGVAGVPAEETLVASTGVIGRRLPMDVITRAIAELRPSREGGRDFAHAIMTTDTMVKEAAVRVRVGSETFTIGAVAKGAGMAHPDMATVLVFVTTDAAVEPAYLQRTLKEIADVTINMVDVDMDTSTSDMMLVFANGAAGAASIGPAGAAPIGLGHPAESAFKSAFLQVCTKLARDLARDGEGAKTLIQVDVRGARTDAEARLAARTVASSPLIKTMVAGRDANLGRVMMAIGRSGADVDVAKTSVFIGAHCAFANGSPSEVDYALISREMDVEEVKIGVDLGLGAGTATAWGCDLTEGYIRINADYTT